MTLTYAIADIHGMKTMMDAALAMIAEDAAGQPRTVVFLGDYADRGPDGRGVISALRDGPTDPLETWICLRGNHDELLVRSSNGDVSAQNDWMSNGGIPTLWQYMPDRKITDKGLADIKVDGDFLKTLPAIHDDGIRIFVHAGLRPGVAIADQDEGDMLMIRDEFLGSEFDFGKPVVHGHTISTDPHIHATRIGLDTGAYSTNGKLSVAAFVGDEPLPQRILTVRHPAPDGTMEMIVEDAAVYQQANAVYKGY